MAARLFRGGYEDLGLLMLRLEERVCRRDQRDRPAKPPWKRLLLEFPLNLAGALCALLLRSLPNVVVERFFLLMFDLITGYKYQSNGIAIAQSNEDAVKIYRYIISKYEPALLCPTSHPPVIGDTRDLNLGLMAAGFRLMRSLHGARRPFRIVAAVDVMALDTLHLYEEGLYAGGVGLYHVSTDRLPSMRNPVQGLLFGGISYRYASWRLQIALRSKHNLVMTLAGGVAETARLLYTTRELVWRLRQQSAKRPREVLEALSSDAGFRRFAENFQEGGNVWKRVECYLAALFARDPLAAAVPRGKLAPCETGDLDPEDLAAIRTVAAAFGLEPPAVEEIVAGFLEEFRRITPYRERLFRILLRRVVRKGTPILILPLDFSLEHTSPILQRPPIALVPGTNGPQRVRLEGSAIVVEPIDEVGFARDWVRETFGA